MLPKSFVIRDKKKRRLKIEIIFEDEYILVINKPANLPVIPDRWNPHLPNLRDTTVSKYRKTTDQSIWLVHRIDAETSGLVLFAKTAEMHQKLNQSFESGKIEKTYLAIVSGHPSEDEGIIKLPIARHPSRKNYMQIHEKGKPSITMYHLIEKFQHFSLLQVYPQTGRTHQIRVHLKAINCPLAVDSVYGVSGNIKISHIKSHYRPKRNETTPPSLIERLTLHAFKIEFEDPIRKNRKWQFEAPAPKDFCALIKSLRKYDKFNGR